MLKNSIKENQTSIAVPTESERQSTGLVMTRLSLELKSYLDTLSIDSNNIGEVRRSCFVPWDSSWNGLVRDETAQREFMLTDSPEPTGSTSVGSTRADSDVAKWQPIETAPKDGTQILLASQGVENTGYMRLCGRWACKTHAYKAFTHDCFREPDCEGGWSVGLGWLGGTITHWMPLPEPPNISTQDAGRG